MNKNINYPENLLADIFDGTYSLEYNGNMEDLRSAIENLSERQETVIYLRYINEFTYKMIGEKLGVTVEGARQIKVKSLRILRKYYREKSTSNEQKK